jgi:hypothetical protein
MSATRRADAAARLRLFVRMVEQEDELLVAQVLRLSRSRRLFAPLAYTVGAFAMLVNGLRRLLRDQWLIVIELLPAVWLWLAMYDLRLQLFRGRSFHGANEARLVPIAALILVVTVVAVFLNVVFAFLVSQRLEPSVPEAWRGARRHARTIVVASGLVAAALAASITVGSGLPHPLFVVTLSVAVALLMVVNLALPARLLRLEQHRSRRDQVAASAIGAALSVVVTAPFYVLSQVGLLLVGTSALAALGYVLLTSGVLLQACGVGAVRAIRMSGALLGPSTPDGADRQA